MHVRFVFLGLWRSFAAHQLTAVAQSCSWRSAFHCASGPPPSSRPRRYAPLGSSLRSLSGAADAGGSGGAEEARRLEAEADELIRTGAMREAEDRFKRAVDVAASALGPGHALTVRLLFKVGVLYTNQERLAEAEPFLERCLAESTRLFGPEDPRVGSCLKALGDLLMRQGRPDEGQILIEKSLAIQAAQGQDSPDFAVALQACAAIFAKNGALEKARPLMERSPIRSDRLLLPPSPPPHSLGLVYTQLGDIDSAQQALERALALRTAALGPDHHLVTETITLLADLAERRGDPAAAVTLLERALSSFIRLLGPAATDNLKVGYISIRLGQLYGEHDSPLRDDARSIALLEAAQGAFSRSLGQTHPAVLDSLAELARVYAQAGRWVDASAVSERAASLLSEGDERLGRALAMAGEARLNAGDPEGALPILERALGALGAPAEAPQAGEGEGAAPEGWDVRTCRALLRRARGEDLASEGAGAAGGGEAAEADPGAAASNSGDAGEKDSRPER
eukprot:tig00020563_g11320.t1